MEQIGFFRVIRNPTFKKITLFSRTKTIMVLILAIISVFIYTSFPLITHFYITTLYTSSISILALATLAFIMLFCIKWYIDTIVEKYKVKYYAKIEKNIKEHILEVYSQRLEWLVNKKSQLYTKYVFLYGLLVQTITNTLLNTAKIFIVLLTIFFFDKSLFVYALFAIPFFIIFYALIQLKSLKPKDKSVRFDSDMTLIITRSLKLSKRDAKTYIRRSLDENLKSQIANRTQFTTITTSMQGFISLYRVVFLAYFGYYFITQGVAIHNVIIGLLFLTLLYKPMISILQDSKYYHICARAYSDVNKIYSL